MRSYAVGDPFQLVGDHCAKVHLSHVLRHHMAQGPLPKCLRVMHLAWEGLINLDSLTDIWEHLPESLLAELLRGFLGRMCSSRHNLLGYLFRILDYTPYPGGLPTGLPIISHGTRCLDTSPSPSSSRGRSCPGPQILMSTILTYLVVPLPLTSGIGRHF